MIYVGDPDDAQSTSDPADPPAVGEGRHVRGKFWTPERRVRRRRVVLVLCVLAVLGVYYRCAVTDGKDLNPAPVRTDVQNLQANAFLHGQLNLRLAVPPGLAELPDPFDATANAPYRAAGLHDLSFYDGKLYGYAGPVPVLLLYVPYRLLFGGYMAPTLACLLFCACGYLALLRAFQRTAAFFIGPISLPVEATAVVALGLAGPIAWMVHIGRAYEVAIACGFFMIACGLLFLARALFSKTAHPAMELAFASAFFSAAIGARPSLLWSLGFVVFALAFVRWGPTRQSWSQRSAVIAAAVPCAVIGAALAWYNVVRFGAVSEFGTNYMMLGENVRLARADELGFLRRGFFEYMLSPARYDHGFRLRPFAYSYPTEQNYLLEPVAGIGPNMPALVLGFIPFFIAPYRWLRERFWFALLIGVAVIVGLVTLAAISYHFHGATMRYELDFAPPLMFASVLGGAAWITRIESTRLRCLAGSAALLVVAWSVFFALSITAYPCAGTGSC